MDKKSPAVREVFDPPGGILVWILIFLEMLTFGLALVFMASASRGEAALFHQSRGQLSAIAGTANTLVLLSSGYFMATALQLYRMKQWGRSSQHLLAAMLLGLLFIGIKGWEYSGKLEEGLTLDSNTFFTFYWMLTGFHFIHVVIGLVIIGALRRTVFSAESDTHTEFFEAGAAFWHLCDLIWLMIFPALYLFF